MTTKGIIKRINYNDNMATIRMPVFEGAGNLSEVLAEAMICAEPGIIQSYKIGDIVIVAFEDDQYNKPVILGKLFLGAEQESKTIGGNIRCDSLKVESKISIPWTAELRYQEGNTTNVQTDNSGLQFETIADLINKVLTLETSQVSLLTTISELTNRVYALETSKIELQATIAELEKKLDTSS